MTEDRSPTFVESGFNPIDALKTRNRLLTSHLLDTLGQTLPSDEKYLEYMPWTLTNSRDFIQKSDGLKSELQTYINTICSRVKTISVEGLHGTGKSILGSKLASHYGAPLLKLSGYIKRSEFEMYGITGVVKDLYGGELVAAEKERDGEKSWHTLQKVYFWYLDHEYKSGRNIIISDRGPITRMSNWWKYRNSRRFLTPFTTEYSHPFIDSQLTYGNTQIEKSDFLILVPIPNVIYMQAPPWQDISSDRSNSNEKNLYRYDTLASEVNSILSPLNKMSMDYN